MSWLEFVWVAIESILANKLRSFLTVLGIVIGIAAVIIVMAVGQGGRAMLLSEMEKMGSNLFFIYYNYEEGEYMKPWDIRVSDATAIKQLLPEVKYLVPVSYNRLKIRGPRKESATEIIGTSADYAKVRNLEIEKGRFITTADEKAGRRVIVLDYELAGKMFGSNDPLGKRVLVDNYSAVVIGIIKKDESAMKFDSRERAYLPLNYLHEITGVPYVQELAGTTFTKDQVALVIDQSKKIMERRHQAPGQYSAFNMEKEVQSANQVTGIMATVIGAIAAISLIVGGIGVMNIMLVSVSERTREIGIRMALGARRSDILYQFLIEAIVLCLFGGT